MQEGLGDGAAEDERLQRLRPELRREANVQAAVHQQQGTTLSLSVTGFVRRMWDHAT